MWFQHDVDDLTSRGYTDEMDDNLFPGPIQAGAKAIPFSLPDEDGKILSFSNELSKGPLVIVFYRGDW
jgi:hypothetical protein